MADRVRVLVGALGAGFPAGPTTVLLDLGAEHPSHAGLLELRLLAEDGVIVEADVVIGAMHRGVEKLFEVRDYRQILMLADRHDWQAPFFGELAAALACEELLGLQVPPRAVWLRTLLAEHTRILSHLGFLGWLAGPTSPAGPNAALAARVASAREDLRRQNMRLTGSRIHLMVTRLGGLATDASPEWLDTELGLNDGLAELGRDLAALPLPEAVAPVTTQTIDAYGLSGPLARASAVPLDLRRDRPYLAYGELAGLLAHDLRPGSGAGTEPEADASQPGARERTPGDADQPRDSECCPGDAAARLRLLAQEVGQSAALVRRCAERLQTESGPVGVKLPKVLKLPDAETYFAVEAPLGRAGFHLVSRGDKTPWRLKLRTPSFAHVAALPRVLPGCRVAELEYALASIGYVIGDVDK